MVVFACLLAVALRGSLVLHALRCALLCQLALLAGLAGPALIDKVSRCWPVSIFNPQSSGPEALYAISYAKSREQTCGNKHAGTNMREQTCGNKHAGTNMREQTCGNKHAGTTLREPGALHVIRDEFLESVL